jgi:hypothetical protein
MAVTTCPKCGAELHRGDWPFCDAPGGHGSVFNVNAARFEPVLVFEDAGGNVRFPGSHDDPVPPGFAKRELRTIHEVRAFENRMNREERARWERHQEAEHNAWSAAEKERRAQLRAEMQHMSAAGRDFARYAMEQNDRRPRENFDPGFRIAVFSDDASNREAHRSERTGWAGRKA